VRSAFTALEQLTRNEQVSGSSPLVGSHRIGIGKPTTRYKGCSDGTRIGFLTPLVFSSAGVDPLRSGLSTLYRYERRGKNNHCRSHLRPVILAGGIGRRLPEEEGVALD
jgi:hypothetical protein